MPPSPPGPLCRATFPQVPSRSSPGAAVTPQARSHIPAGFPNICSLVPRGCAPGPPWTWGMLMVAEDAAWLQRAGVLLAPSGHEVCVLGPPCWGGRRQHALPSAGRALPAPPCAAPTSGQPLCLNQFGKLVFGLWHGGEPGQWLWTTQISYMLLLHCSARQCCEHRVSPFPGDKQHLPDFASIYAFSRKSQKNPPRDPLARHAQALPHLERGCWEIFMLMRWDEIKTLGFCPVVPAIRETEEPSGGVVVLY